VLHESLSHSSKLAVPDNMRAAVSLRILLVYVDIGTLQYMGRLLGSWGHRVHTFVGRSVEAVDRVLKAATGLRFDVAIIGTIMPGMGGTQLLESIHRVSPSTRLIGADCGPCVETSAELAKKGLKVQTLLLPFNHEDLQELLREAVLTRVQEIEAESARNQKFEETDPPWSRDFVKFQVAEVKSLHPRHCSWCSQEISKEGSALVVFGLKNRSPRFCSKDCFQSWDSIYWQRIAIRNLGLSIEEFRSEERNLKRQRRFLQSRP
jgi:CheY-like chemotaxis protein